MRTYGKVILSATLAFSLAEALPAQVQEPNPPAQQPTGGWRRFGGPAPTEPPGSGQPAEAPPQAQPPMPAAYPPAGPLTVPAGSWITVRVDGPISSDRNQSGDAFTATLAQPIVVNGRVIARRGQTVAGVVAEAEKAGHVKGTSKLALEITELSLADGRQIPVKTRLMERRGDTSVGRDAAAIGTTTGVGAAIGAAADGGFGAGMGAIAGAAASTIGVLVTRGRATVVYPETPLTFRLESAITIPAEAAEAFGPVTQADYEQRTLRRQGPPTMGPPMAPPPYYYSYYYPPYYYGPSFYFYSGPRFYSRGFRRW